LVLHAGFLEKLSAKLGTWFRLCITNLTLILILGLH